MKTLPARLTLTSSGLVSANEYHLLMIPIPIQDRVGIHIVNRPMISGYGADFEGKCDRIAAPYPGEVRSPSNNVSELDMNPASLAKIKLSAAPGPNDNNVYKVTMDYSNATEDSKVDARLLRSILTCVYTFGDSLHGYLKLKVNFELTGPDAKSALQAELFRIIDARKQQIDTFEQVGNRPQPTRPEFERPAY